MRINRHANKRMHKHVLKRKYAFLMGRPHYSDAMLRDYHESDYDEHRDDYWYRKHPPRNNGFEYWTQMSRSGRKDFAKKQTNKRLRQRIRDRMAHVDPNDLSRMKGHDYKRAFDYWWEIY